MFTKKPETGESVTKMGERYGRAEDALHRAAGNLCSQESEPSASKMVPSIIGEDLSITGNVTSKGEIQVDGEIQGDINCGSLLLGDKSQVIGGVHGRRRRRARTGGRLDQGFARHAAGAVACRGRYRPSESRHRAGGVFRRQSRAARTIRWRRSRRKPEAARASRRAPTSPQLSTTSRTTRRA